MSLFGCDHGPLIAQLRADLAASDEALVAERAALATERFRYDVLLQTVLAMKQAGATVVPVASSVVQPDPPTLREEQDELKALIDVQCGRDYRKRQMMLAQLTTDRAGGVDPDQIKAAIVNGVQAEGVP